jgi:hypothetical protein
MRKVFLVAGATVTAIVVAVLSSPIAQAMTYD